MKTNSHKSNKKPPPPPTTTNSSRVGGPLLGYCRPSSLRSVTKRQQPSSGKSRIIFEPIITPLIHGKEQFILLPHGNFVTVLAYKTGRKVTTLLPNNKSTTNDDDIIIESICLASLPCKTKATSTVDALNQLRSEKNDKDDTYSSSFNTSDDEDDDEDMGLLQERFEYVVLVGCNDATLREFSLEELVKQRSTRKTTIPPRRIFSLSHEKYPLSHIAVPSGISTEEGEGILVYALMDHSSHNKDTKKHSFKLVRVKVPSFDKGDDIGTESSSETKIKNLWDTPGKEEEKKTAIQVSLDTIKCRAGTHKNNTLPFKLIATSPPVVSSSSSSDRKNIYIVIARSNSIAVYEDSILPSTRSSAPVILPVSVKNPLSALAISNHDIACGHNQGDIVILNDIFTLIAKYNIETKKTPEETNNSNNASLIHPSKSVLIRKLHWHAHPVTTLSYLGGLSGAGSILYSGGDESVLVTWQLSRGTYRPSDVLPRLSKGGIVHIACADGDMGGGGSYINETNGVGSSGNEDGNGILVFCEDNTMQLFESHNRSLMWRIQGLPSDETFVQRTPSVALAESKIIPDPHVASSTSNNRHILLCGMTGSPGYIHWYDPQKERVSGVLEVAPYNRVSRTEHTDLPMPSPALVQSAFSRSGHHLITVDATPTENSHIGKQTVLRNGDTVGVTHTVRFWSWNVTESSSSTKGALSSSVQSKGKETAMPYSLVAAMTSPHGGENTISSLAMSNDGQFACTVSNDENAFRVWHHLNLSDLLLDEQEQQQSDDKQQGLCPPAWSCQYKITTPAGYSNLGTRKNGVTFSSDGSMLAIAYGNTLTLWDHENATLLTTVRHLIDDSSPIESVKFIKTNALHDLILTESRNGVTLQSPFGETGHTCWSYAIPQNERNNLHVSQVAFMPSHEAVAVSLYCPKINQSQVVVLDAATGTPKKVQSGEKQGKETALSWSVKGCVDSIGSGGQENAVSDWNPTKQASSIGIYALTNDGQIMLLQQKGAKSTIGTALGQKSTTSTSLKRRTVLSTTDAPSLDLPSHEKKKARKLSMEDLSEADREDKFENFGNFMSEEGVAGAPLASSDLPVLSAAFTRAFASRNLARYIEPSTSDTVDT